MTRAFPSLVYQMEINQFPSIKSFTLIGGLFNYIIVILPLGEGIGHPGPGGKQAAAEPQGSKGTLKTNYSAGEN